MVGSVASRLTEQDSGIALGPGQIGIAAAIYIVGACLGGLSGARLRSVTGFDGGGQVRARRCTPDARAAWTQAGSAPRIGSWTVRSKRSHERLPSTDRPSGENSPGSSGRGTGVPAGSGLRSPPPFTRDGYGAWPGAPTALRSDQRCAAWVPAPEEMSREELIAREPRNDFPILLVFPRVSGTLPSRDPG